MIDTTIKELIARDFVLLQAVTRKAWAKTVYTHDSLTPYRNTYDLGELDVADSTSVGTHQRNDKPEEGTRQGICFNMGRHGNKRS